MTISDLYWKWKRFFRKKKELIGRILSITLTVALLALVAYAGYSIYESDQDRAAAKSNKKVVVDIKSNPDPDYDYKLTGAENFIVVAQNDKMTLKANTNTGEICVVDEYGKEWYSNPQDRSKVTLRKGKTKLGAQFIGTFLNTEAGILVEDMDNHDKSISKGTMTHEIVMEGDKPIGIKFTFGMTFVNTYIPIQYTLTDDGFQAEVVVNEIKYTGIHLVDHIELLPFFGAAGEDDAGYLFVPDGSGALVEFNSGKDHMHDYEAPVYGNNLTIVSTKQESVRETVRLPIFGAKVNNNAFLGVITSGDANSTISAASRGQMNAYNVVYSSGILTDYSLYQTREQGGNGKNTFSISLRENQTEGANYTVRYFFMEGDDANYVGMSNRYREYLEENNLLKDSNLSDKKYMVLDLVGAVSIKKYVMGVKKPVVTALTTYNDVVEIVKELKGKGVDNLIVNYIGSMDGGLNNTIYDEVDVESVLGSKREFQNMVSYLEKEGVMLFLESNPVDLYENGNGYKENQDSVKTYFDSYAFQYKYFLDTLKSDSATRWHLMRPKMVSQAVESFAASMNELSLTNLSLDRVGGVLYSDYDEDETNYISRASTKELWCNMLGEASASVKYLMLHGGNAYVTAYADIITNVSDSYSGFDMQDRGVPFYQITFQDNTVLTADGINTTVDYRYAYLKALETGTSLKYNLIYGDISELVGTEYNTMVSYSYSYWKDLAIEQYLDMQENVGHLAGEKITSHVYLAKDVTLTKYETGTVIVNYGTEAFEYEGKVIAAMDYLVI